MHDSYPLTGLLGYVEIRDEAGRLIAQAKNRVTASVINGLRNVLAGQSPGVPRATHLAVGTSATAARTADTDLGNEAWRGAVTSVDHATDYIVRFRTFLATADANGNTIREIGLFSAASGGVLIARAVLGAPIQKTASKSYTIVYTINLSPVS